MAKLKSENNLTTNYNNPAVRFHFGLYTVKLSQGGFQRQRLGNVNFLRDERSKLHDFGCANTQEFIKLACSLTHTKSHTQIHKRAHTHKNKTHSRIHNLTPGCQGKAVKQALKPVGKFKCETIQPLKT